MNLSIPRAARIAALLLCLLALAGCAKDAPTAPADNDAGHGEPGRVASMLPSAQTMASAR